MKTTLRRTLATALSAVALTMGLGTIAAPAQAASCSDLSSLKGKISSSTYSWTSTRYQVDATVSNGVTGCADSSSVHYVLEVIDSSDRVALRIDSRNTLRGRGAGIGSYDTFIGSGTTDYIYNGDSHVLVRVAAVNSRYGIVLEEASWIVKSPNDGFNSATGDDVLTFGDSCKTHIRGSYC